jgi:hypothetical protein
MVDKYVCQGRQGLLPRLRGCCRRYCHWGTDWFLPEREDPCYVVKAEERYRGSDAKGRV